MTSAPTPAEIIRAIETAAGFEGIGGEGVEVVESKYNNLFDILFVKGRYTMAVCKFEWPRDEQLGLRSPVIKHSSMYSTPMSGIVAGEGSWDAIHAALGHLIKLRDGAAERIAAKATEMLNGKESNHE